LLNKLLEETFLFNDIRLVQSVDAAYSELKHFYPDIIFLDIKMPGKDGFTFIQDLPVNTRINKIVFVTAYDQFAIKAIKNQAFDYLLKPVNRKELKQCLTRFIESNKTNIIIENPVKIIEPRERLTRIRVNTRTGTLFINPVDILFCKAEGNYTTVCTGKKQHLCSMNLGKVAELLPLNGFIRVGRSYIVNFEYITMLDRKESTVMLVRDGESATIKIPRHHLKDLDII
jgi:two-component system LytT family response regulator